MSDERPPDDREPEQAELELGEVSDETEESPSSADAGALPPPTARAAATASEADVDADADAELIEAAEAATELDSVDDDLDEETVDEPDEADLEDLLEDLAAHGDEAVSEDGEEQPGVAVADPYPESTGVELPTSWPDPIPVGTLAPEPTRFQGITITPPLVILASLVTLSFILFVAIEPTPRWLLLFTAIIAVLGTDGVLRQAWPRPFSRSDDAADSTPYLFLPALAAVAWPMLIEHNVRGYLVLPAALLAGLAFGAMLMAQISSVRVTAPVYPLTRLASTAAVYFTAFALFSLSYILDVELPAAIAAVAVIAAMLGVELFREGEVDPLETLVFAGVTGVILAEARWAMYYVPVGGYLAGLALLLGFFLITGLLHSHLTRRLNNVVALEYAGIASAGVLLVTVAGQAGLG